MRRPRSLRALTLSSSVTTGPASLPAGPPSPTFTATTNASQMDLRLGLPPGKIITRADLRASLQAYDDLLTSSAKYRTALSQMAKASAGFAKAIETTSRLKGGTDEAAVGLQAAAGLHHLMANHWEVLGHSISENFEKPLSVELETYHTVVTERSSTYEKALHEKSKIIRQTEVENMATGRKKQRDLNSFRAALNVLQAQVDELDRLKAAHYKEICEHEEEVWTVVLGKVSLVVRSSLEVFDRLTAKQTDPILEPMLQAIPDPFNSYGPPKGEDQIFSILPPLAIMASGSGQVASSPVLTTPDLDPANSSLEQQSWVEQARSPYNSYSSSEWTESKSPSPPPVPIAPAPMYKRHSHPTASISTSPPGHPPRRSESKLRSVLASVEEQPTSTSHSRIHSSRSENASSSTTTSGGSDRTALWSQDQAAYNLSDNIIDNSLNAGDSTTPTADVPAKSSIIRTQPSVSRPHSPLRNGMNADEQLFDVQQQIPS